MSDLEILDPEPSPVKSRKGGARPGAGRKPNGYVKPPEKVNFDVARARKENAQADLAELEYGRKRGALIERYAVRDACSHALSAVAQSLRSLPDLLERRHGLTPEQAEAATETIDAALSALSDTLQQIHDNGEGYEDERADD